MASLSRPPWIPRVGGNQWRHNPCHLRVGRNWPTLAVTLAVWGPPSEEANKATSPLPSLVLQNGEADHGYIHTPFSGSQGRGGPDVVLPMPYTTRERGSSAQNCSKEQCKVTTSTQASGRGHKSKAPRTRWKSRTPLQGPADHMGSAR